MWCKTILQLVTLGFRAVELTARIVTLRLAETFVIARESSDEDDVVQVELRHDGVTGSARARRSSATTSRPSRRSRTSRSTRRCSATTRSRSRRSRRGCRRPGENAAKAALDGALHDLQGQAARRPGLGLLGLPRTGPPTSWTVWLGDPDDMARRAERRRRASGA